MKIRIIDKNGVHFGGKILPEGSVHDLAKSPHTDAWLRFNQAEEVKEQPAEAAPSTPASPSGAGGGGEPLPPKAPEAPAAPQPPKKK